MKLITWLLPTLAIVSGFGAGSLLSISHQSATNGHCEATPKGQGHPDPFPVERLQNENDLDALLSQLRQMSPPQAYSALLGLSGINVGELLAKLVEGHGPESGQALLAIFLMHPEHHHSFSIASTVFRHAAQGDPALAWREAEAHAMHFLPAMLPALAQGMSRKAPLEAIAHAASIRSPGMRETFIREVLEEWSGTDAPGLLSWLAQQSDAKKLARLVKWGRMRLSSPHQLARLADLMPSSTVPNSTDSRLLFGEPSEDLWIRRTDWLLTIPPGAARDKLCNLAAISLTSVDPEAALKLLPALTEPAIRRQVLTAAAGFRAAASPMDGLAFADTMQDAQEREAARYAVFITWAENAPAAFSRHAIQSNDPDATRAMSTGGTYWAMKDPEGAAEFALQHDLPKGAKTETALAGMLSSTVRVWASKDPVGAANWVNGQPRGPQRDRAAAAIAGAAAIRFPEEAMIWAFDISDEAPRRQAIDLCFSTWLRMRPEQAAEWLKAAQMDDATRQRLTSSLQDHRARPFTGATQNLSQGTVVIY